MGQEENYAVVREVNGKLVLEDPIAEAFINAVEHHNSAIAKSNCRKTFELGYERIQYFKQRIAEKELTSAQVVIVLINVDDYYGRPIADILMPNYDWQDIRDSGEVPFARGIVERENMENIVNVLDEAAAVKLKQIENEEIAVIVIDHNVVEIFTV